MRVLIADDDPACREVLAAVLEEGGHDVVIAQDGNEAWGILQNPRSPRLVFLDWVMPGMEGPEVCQRLRKREDGGYVYVIMLTANEDMGSVQEAFGAGVNDYVNKAASVEELMARIQSAQRFFKLYEELVAAKETIQHLRQYDVATGLEGHRAILDMLQKEVVRARDQKQPLGAALVRVDHFRMISETYGRRAAEYVLREAAGRISEQIRPYDAAGRFGDDEFLIVAPDFDEDAIADLTERTRKLIAQKPIRVGTETIAFTASLGVVSGCPDDDDVNADSYIRAAREARDRAARDDGNQVVIGSVPGTVSVEKDDASGKQGSRPGGRDKRARAAVGSSA